jgi:nicotinamidase-related amidase
LTKTIAAQPFDFTFEPADTALIVIDMQRDFIEPGGFGATLGNDVSLLKKIVPTVGRLIDAFRIAGLPIIHTRECHKPDLSDLPKAKHLRGKASMRIGDPGPMGRILIAGEPGADIVPELAARPGEIVVDKPGKGAFYATPLSSILAEWQSADSYATRFQDIDTGAGGGLNGTFKLNFGTTVKDDGSIDSVTAALVSPLSIID